MLAVVPVAQIAGTDAPLQLVVDASSIDALGPVVRVGAGIAALGVLLNLVPGVSRTVLAMARRARAARAGSPPIDERRSLPWRAELCVVGVVTVATAFADLRGAIGFSGVTVLTYYAITNASARSRSPRRSAAGRDGSPCSASSAASRSS